MIKQTSILFFLIFPFLLVAQTEELDKTKFTLSEGNAWHADLLGNLYIAQEEFLVKYDTSGVKQYSQSIKSIGTIKKISSVNTMRIVLFSEEQQTITLTDNTLSETTESYDLTQLGFEYVTHIAVSSQANKFWIYDQPDSKLVLLDLGRTNQRQEIENFRGIISSSEVRWMEEENNKLYLFDQNQNLFIFDLYGSLLDLIELPSVSKVKVFQGEIVVLKEGTLSRYSQEDASLKEINTPISDFHDFQWRNNFLFLQTNQEILKIRN